jgi:hypothetical protein
VSAPARFPFLPRGAGSGPLDLAPLLPARLSRNGVDVDIVGLVDSGASFSVLPYDVGARFGLDWNRLPNGLILGGAAGGIPAKLIALDLTFGPFGPVSQLFAWADRTGPPIVFGQATFFLNFDDVFFARARGFFEIQPATAPTP